MASSITSSVGGDSRVPDARVPASSARSAAGGRAARVALVAASCGPVVGPAGTRANRSRIHAPSCIGVASSGEPFTNVSSVWASSIALGRSSRRFCRARVSALASGGGVVGAISEIEGRLPSRIWRIASTASPRPTIVRPASSSHSTMPSENTSLRPSSGDAVVCSGDMYAYLPLTWPGLVRSSVIAAALAMPKSHSLTTPSYDTIKFAGDTSRWTRPIGPPVEPRSSCAWWSAAAASAPRRATSAGGSFSCAACLNSCPACTPSMNSIAMK